MTELPGQIKICKLKCYKLEMYLPLAYKEINWRNYSSF